MNNWKEFCAGLCKQKATLEQLKEAVAGHPDCGIYPDSLQQIDGVTLFMAREAEGKVLVIYPRSAISERFNGDEIEFEGCAAKICPPDLANCRVLREIFPFTRPVSHQGRPVTIGLGDRLGLASPGHLRTVKGLDVFPVLAQQSIRELNLTGRTYDDVLAAASWAVYQEGYEQGFGADGDHLKTEQEVKMALDCGVTMITLDCSEQIQNDVPDLPDEEINARYAQIPADERADLEKHWFGRTVHITGKTTLRFTPDGVRRIVLIYRDAIRHARKIYSNLIVPAKRPIDFELSIDETLTPTTPEAHYFVATTLIDAGVVMTSLAPRFCGEFQKGIDYRGDIDAFRIDFDCHSQIARKLGYKISVHSGSDKFSVFPIVGELTGHVFHLKTAGTNWLEAVRVIAAKDPALYRELHAWALANLDEARQYYHISADPGRIAPLDSLPDDQLPDLMNQDDARQVLHITYGLLLKARNEDGTERFRSRIYAFLNANEEAYSETLQRHIGRHLQLLGLTSKA
jgi:hypothetical protein